MATNANAEPKEQQGVPESAPQPQPVEREPSAATLLDKIVSSGKIGERRDEAIMSQVEFMTKQRLAKMFVRSGCFVDVDKDGDKFLPEEMSIARAMLKIELGESMGFSPAESMAGIDLIKSRPAIGAHLRAARMHMAGYSWPAMRVTDKGCWMPLEFQGRPMLHQQIDEQGKPMLDKDGKPVMVQVVVKFDENDASRLGLLEKTGSMYKKSPSDMYFARTVTRAQRRYAPAALKGAPVLDTYEAQDIAEYVPPDPKAFEQAVVEAGGGLKGKVAAATGRAQSDAARSAAALSKQSDSMKLAESPSPQGL